MPAAKRKTSRKASAKKTSAKKQSSKSTTSADAVDEQLARYRSMRDFDITAEPSGVVQDPRETLPFCIQKHAASHLHYDFRLGWNGVLKSWACAKGPSYTVGDKRLAVQVEDHPMEYGGFEGIIPAGQYGGGTVMLWDQGSWAPQKGYEDVDAGLRDGHLKFTLDGTKMHGKWALIRMRGKADTEKKPNWLLIKEHDDFERAAKHRGVTDAEPNSVVTNRSIEQIAASKDHVWNSKATNSGPKAWHRRDPQDEAQQVPRQKSEFEATRKQIASLPRESQPTFLKPQLAQETELPPEDSDWIYELKLDGYRMQARKDGAKVQMLTRSGLDWTDRVRSVAAEVAKLPFKQVTLDGEVVVVAENGTTNFADLQASMQEGARKPLTYFSFDLLHIDGHNPRGLPLLERKKLLAEVVLNADEHILQISEHLTANGRAMFRKACELHAEGIVSKRGSAVYTSGRSAAWVKCKCLHEQEFVIGGFTLPGKGNAGGHGLGALLLGYYDDEGNLIYAGRTGTGFTHVFAAKLRTRLETIQCDKCPFVKLSTGPQKGAMWVVPELVAQVRFATWTAVHQLRQAAFLGLREDKPAKQIRRETAAPMPKSSKSERRTATSVKRASVDNSSGDPLPHPLVRMTHPEKVLDPTSGLTKQQLADYYWAVSTAMLPHIVDRPLSLVRVPEGIGKEQFFQKHVTSTLPPGFGSITVPNKKTGVPEKYIALSTSATREAIASLAQMSVLEVHPWGSTGSDLERPDRLVIDLDPDESLSWAVLAGAAADVRKRLKALGLESFLKTTGGKGLHIVIPIEPEFEWPEIKEFCRDFVVLMERAKPTLYLTKMTRSARAGKIYLDYLRNERGATAVAPYSPRARANVGVAVPLDWSELKLPSRPDFRVGNFAEWSHRLKKDPWVKMFQVKQHIPQATLSRAS